MYLLKYPYRAMLMPLSKRLNGVHPDVLSYLAVAATAGAAACYVHSAQRPVLLLAAVGLTLLRMTLNTLDGLLAVGRGRMSLIGEVVNALPDRYSDVLVVIGIGVSPLCGSAWALLGLASMLLVSYTGMLGKAVGVEWQHHGPMGKVERLISLMILSLFQYGLLLGGQAAWTAFGWQVTPLECWMILLIGLGQVTIVNRTRGMVRQIRRSEWPATRKHRLNGSRALVTYDSITGNTAKVAAAIAEGLGADLMEVAAVGDVEDYELVVIGSPTIRSRPTGKVQRFLRMHRESGNMAGFVTYGAPIIGPGMARRALRRFEEALGAGLVGGFACKGCHAKAPRLNANHPDGDDLLGAYLFGVKLAKKLTR
ncbi:MAG: flavodoxin family protein [Planctomycetota bacterium]|jgi:phosphatidylglycerophosphate synthase/flavodoxin